MPVSTPVSLYLDRLLPIHHDSLLGRITLRYVPTLSLTNGILSEAKIFRKRIRTPQCLGVLSTISRSLAQCRALPAWVWLLLIRMY